MVYIGIDPGKNGALAIMENDSVTVIPFDEKNYKFELSCVRLSKCICAIEKVGAMPGQGVTSMFNFGKNFGFITGLLEAYEIPYQEVSPQSWKREYGLIGKGKEQSIEVCRKLFPNVNLRQSLRSRADNDGMAEALLIAEYARRKL